MKNKFQKFLKRFRFLKSELSSWKIGGTLRKNGKTIKLSLSFFKRTYIVFFYDAQPEKQKFTWKEIAAGHHKKIDNLQNSAII